MIAINDLYRLADVLFVSMELSGKSRRIDGRGSVVVKIPDMGGLALKFSMNIVSSYVNDDTLSVGLLVSMRGDLMLFAACSVSKELVVCLVDKSKFAGLSSNSPRPSMAGLFEDKKVMTLSEAVKLLDTSIVAAWTQSLAKGWRQAALK